MTELPASFATRLLAWFDTNRRDLPWRRTRDPWAIWVSEIMLQQTRVEAVRDSYRRFLARFPTPADFAAASDDELMLAWRGLGYYRRARLLRDGARAVVADHDGTVPRTAERLGQLPGIGRYTRGAIASIAFGEAAPAIDGNVERVAARHRNIATDSKAAPAQRAIAAAVNEWLDRNRPGDFNQALMELGAMVCTPQSPRCETCPVQIDCLAAHAGRAAELPVRRPRRAFVDVEARVALAYARGNALGARVPAGEPNAGQVELPGAGILVSVERGDLGATVRQRHGAELEIGPELATIRHTITHHRIALTAHAATVRNPGMLTWQAIDDQVPWTTASRKVFARAAASDTSGIG